MSTTSWEQYIAEGEAPNAKFAEVAPMPDGATSDDYWSLVPGEDELYFRNINWGSVWSDDHQSAVASIVAEQYSDGRPLERCISTNFDGIDGREQMISISFETARGLSALLAKFDENTEAGAESVGGAQ